MAHTHPVVDSDSRFVINSDTRAITTTSDKLELIQGDHQSERITFEIPQVVEGHDMSLCDRIEIHYVNIDRKTKAQSKDIYIADDVTLDGEKVVFSWLISGNATKYYGRLNFIVLFECLDDEGNYTYKWNTEICKLLTVGEGISNTAAISEDYSDILEKFREEVLGEASQGVVKFTEQELTDEQKFQARSNIDAVSISDAAPIELESIIITTKVDSASTLAFVNSEDINIFIFAAEGTEDVTLKIGSKKFALKPGGFSNGLYTFLYNGSTAAYVNIRGTFRGIGITPSVLGITLTVGDYARITTNLPKVPMAYIPNVLATKDYVNSQKFSGSYNDLTDTPTIPTVTPFSIDSTASDYSTTSTTYGDQVKTALLAGRDVWYIGAETDESGKTTTKYTKVSWFNIEKTDTEAKLIVGVGARTDDNSGAVTFAISV